MYGESLTQQVFSLLCILVLVPFASIILLFLYIHWKLLAFVFLCAMMGYAYSVSTAVGNSWLFVVVVYTFIILTLTYKGKRRG